MDIPYIGDDFSTIAPGIEVERVGAENRGVGRRSRTQTCDSGRTDIAASFGERTALMIGESGLEKE